MGNISNLAKIGENLTIGKNSEIRDCAIIGDNVLIENNVIIGVNATIQDNVFIGSGSKIWDNSFIRSNIGMNCIIARNVYVDIQVPIGNNVKIQNRNNITHGVIIEDGVFVGPNVTFSNDKYPRAVNIDGTLKSGSDWECIKTLIKKGASLGAGSVIVCGVTIGEWSMIGAGSVVTRNVPAFAMVVGNPAKIIKWVSKKGIPMTFIREEDEYAIFYSSEENIEYMIPIKDYQLMNL